MSDNETIRVTDKRLASLKDNGDENDYQSWAGKAQDKLENLDYWKYIEGSGAVMPTVLELEKSTKKPGSLRRTGGNELAVAKAERDLAEWKKGDRMAKSMIVQAMPGHKVHIVRFCNSAKEAWEALINEYAAPNRMKAVTIAQTIMQYKCKDDLDPTKWTDRMRVLFVQLQQLDSKQMSDKEFGKHLSTLLPSTQAWRAFNRDLRDKVIKAEDEGKPLPSATIISWIRDEDFNQKIDEDDYVAQISQVDSIKKRSAAVANITSSSSSKRPKNQSQSQRTKPTCTNKGCNNAYGHSIENCLSYGGGKAGQYPHWWRGPTDIHLPPDQRKRAPTGQRQLSSGTDFPSTNQAIATRANASIVETNEVSANITEGQFYSLNTFVDPTMQITCHDALFSESNTSVEIADSACYHDSGANRHIFHDKSVFDNYRDISPLQVKGFGSNLTTAAIGVGDIFFVAQCGTNRTEIKLSNVLHVPSARLNLISQGCLERRGIACHSANGVMTLSMNGTGIISGKLLANNLYRLQMKALPRKLADRIAPAGVLSNELALATEAAITPKSQDFYTAY